METAVENSNVTGAIKVCRTFLWMIDFTFLINLKRRRALRYE